MLIGLLIVNDKEEPYSGLLNFTETTPVSVIAPIVYCHELPSAAQVTCSDDYVETHKF